MTESLRALLTGIIDYAGLFPPAALPMEEAVRNYARYRREPESWMLGRFVCRAARLHEFGSYLDLALESGARLSLSVLGGAGNDCDEFLTWLRKDLEATAAFRQRYNGQVLLESLELRLPPALLHLPEPVASCRELLSRVEDLIRASSWRLRSCYYEANTGPEWQTGLSPLLNALSSTCVPGSPGPSAGVKLRCGGLEAAAFPTPDQLAFSIAACRRADVPLKFTAGLHHPLRHFNAEVQTKMHGFLNLFVAGVLAHARGLSEAQIRAIIEDEDPSSFVFDDAGLRWKDFCATTAEITRARQHAVISFGSCSFDEPRDDLRQLGLL
jgi:hypothetical protein